MSGIECERLLAELDRYLDGELPPEESRVVEVHMTECGSCFGREEFVRELRAIIRRKCGTPPMPENMADRILGAIRSLPPDAD